MRSKFSGWLLLLAFAAGAGAANEATGTERPNVILLLLDDAGWKDTGAFGGRMRTPNLDRLAAEGMRFTDCHAPAPNCSPARAGILTGRIPARAGIYSYLPNRHPMHLRDEEITVAELARESGYRTGHFGKWHLSDLENEAQPGPLDQGFEHSLATSNNAAPSHRDPVNFLRNGEPVGKIEGYSCGIVIDETLAWLESIDAGGEKAAPFLACVWFHEPHTPIASPPDLVEACLQRHPDLSRREAAYIANVENVDLAAGRLLERLEERGLADDTVVWLTSDNGPVNAFSRGGLRGVKSNVWEGGHRVPGIVRWPGRVEPGTKCSVPVSGIDFLPTFCDLAGIEPPRDRVVDGVSQLPLWVGSDEDFRRSTPLYWFFYRLDPALAIREGDWALVAGTDDADRPKAHPLLREDMPRLREAMPKRFDLYHLGADIGQTRNLADEESERFEAMKRTLVDLHREVVEEGVVWKIPADYGVGAKRRVWDSR
ncbi:MAG: sulfatase-like hydrolase/transferase [Verrucomicrobiales bacterium]